MSEPNTVSELVDSLPPVERVKRTALLRTLTNRSLADRIRSVADLADAERPDYRAIAHDLWALRVEATQEADTLDARMIDRLCKL